MAPSSKDILIAALDIGLERSDAASKMDRNRLLHKFVEEGGGASAMPHRQFEAQAERGRDGRDGGEVVVLLFG